MRFEWNDQVFRSIYLDDGSMEMNNSIENEKRGCVKIVRPINVNLYRNQHEKAATPKLTLLFSRRGEVRE